ncbi:MAG: T9SS type A sorting domain-containing protein [Bacteroidetes bacterium]|nr:T9SS type A sorting domain-containing protein [Bacteroidota bacterium]
MKTLLLLLICSSAMAFAQLSGTKTIGASGDYTTIASAISALNANGVDGPLTFSLIDETYAETGSNLVISVSSNAPTSVNTVTFKPAATITPEITITGCAASTASGTQADTAKRQAGFTVNNNSNIIIDGSNTVNGTTKDLTFKMNDGTNAIQAIVFFGNCDNIVVKNIIITYQTIPTSSSTRGIYTNGQWSGVADSVIVQNCDIGDATNTPYYATSFTGTSTGGAKYCTGIHVTKSNLYGRIRPIYFFTVGTSTSTCSIEENSVYVPGGANGTTTYYTLFNTWNGYVEIKNNKFLTLTTNNTSTSGIFGLSALTAGANTDCRISNNMFGSDVATNGTGVPTVIALMYIQDNGVYKVYHNTFHLPSNAKATNRVGVYISGASANVTFKNNIIKNSTDASTAYCIYKTSTGTLVSDYNHFDAVGSSTNVGYITSARLTLANWRTGSSQDANSTAGTVTFAGTSDLRLSGGSIGDANLIGTTGLGIPTDIEGDSRSGSFPYKGADEANTPLPVDLNSFTAVARGKNVDLQWTTAAEQNNLGFDVERMVNGAWSRIGFVQGAGNSNAPKEYRYTDAGVANGTVLYRLKQVDADGKFTYHNAIEVVVNAAVTRYELSQNYPNPFNPTTSIRFAVPTTEQATVKVYDMTGREVVELFNQVAAAGQIYNVQFTGTGLASGIYLYVLQTQSYREVKKMSLLK